MLACLDMEGVFVPEIWIIAERTQIPELRVTTRDEPDYDKLMRRRLAILDAHRLGLPDIQRVIATMRPLDGAPEFLAWLHERFQVVILSDTFEQFAAPLMAQLAAFKCAPPTHAVHKLTAAKDHASGLAGCSAFFLTLAATSFLCVGMIDQFTQSEFIPTLPENAVVLLSGFVAITLLAILIWLFSRHEVTLENFE